MASLASFARLSGTFVVLALGAVAATACFNAPIELNENGIKLPERAEGDDAGTEQGLPSPAPPPTTNSTATTVEDAGTVTTPPPPDAAPPPSTAKWFQANGQDCVAFCAGGGSVNVASPDGAKCTSGENIPQSAVTAGITYDKCFPNCNPHVAGSNPHSDKGECYADGQKHDGDSTDKTRGCFCQ